VILYRPFELQDWIDIKAVEPFCPDFPTDNFLNAVKNGAAVTAVQDDKIIACGGIVFLDDTFLWLKVAKGYQSIELAKVIIETAEFLIQTVKTPIYTYVLKNFKKGEKLAKLVGFKKTNETKEYNHHTYMKYVVL